MTTRIEATHQLPNGARWSASFGYPGEGGYVEYWRLPSGERWTIDNGPWDESEPREWTCKRAVVSDVPERSRR